MAKLIEEPEGAYIVSAVVVEIRLETIAVHQGRRMVPLVRRVSIESPTVTSTLELNPDDDRLKIGDQVNVMLWPHAPSTGLKPTAEDLQPTRRVESPTEAGPH